MTQQNIPQITAEEVKQAIDQKKDFVLLDVRTPDEYSREKIEGSINIPVDEVANKIDTIISDKNQLIYVYCLSGSRSQVAVVIMKQLGYPNALSMSSGLLMWRSKSYPLTS